MVIQTMKKWLMVALVIFTMAGVVVAMPVTYAGSTGYGMFDTGFFTVEYPMGWSPSGVAGGGVPAYKDSTWWFSDPDTNYTFKLEIYITPSDTIAHQSYLSYLHGPSDIPEIPTEHFKHFMETLTFREIDASVELDRIIDGDTFEVRIIYSDPRIKKRVETVRLADVDCPELGTLAGDEAAAYTTSILLRAREIWLDIDDKSGDGRGPYGRLICVVYVDGQNFNRMLVDAGHAVVDDHLDNEFNPAEWWE